MKKFLLSLGMVCLLGLGVAAPAMAQREWSEIEGGAMCVGMRAKDGDVATIQGIQCVIANGMNVVMTVFAFVGFAMFIYASVMLLVSRGQPSDFENAKNTLTYAIAGLILAVSSFVIINLISYFTGIQSFMAIKFLADTLQE